VEVEIPIAERSAVNGHSIVVQMNKKEVIYKNLLLPCLRMPSFGILYKSQSVQAIQPVALSSGSLDEDNHCDPVSKAAGF